MAASIRHVAHRRLLPFLIAGATAGVSLSPAILAQSPVLEEIVVTARLRAESLQDVPISVSAVDGQRMFDAGIVKIEDLQAYVPNFTMSQTGIGTNIYIRGIGSGINQGFEQSVGMYVDGIYYGRAQLSRAPFLDLERVEVLRGPQNILYGKNSIAGAVSTTTARPGDSFEGMAAVTYEPRYDEQVYDAMLSGPLSETLGLRFAYRNRTADGYMKNLTLGRDEPQLEEDTARLTLAWRPDDRFDATFKYEHSKFDAKGRAIEIIHDSPTAQAPFTGLNYAQILRNGFAQDASVLNNRADFKRSSNGDYSENETDAAVLTMNFALGDHMLTSITGYLAYDYDELCDCDFTGAPLFNVRSQEDYEQWSQEFRIASPTGGAFEYIAGAYYQTSDLDFRDRFSVPTGSPVPTIIAGNPAFAGNPGLQAAALNLFTDIEAPRNFTQDTDLWSVFGQLTWNLRDDLRLIAGGRYTSEKKDGSRTLTFADAVTGASLDTLDEILLAQTLKAESNSLSGSRKESHFAPQVAVQFDLTPDVMTYASVTKGYKSGGYDARSNASPGGPTYALVPGPAITAGCTNSTINPALGLCLDGAFEYEEEEATGYEIGIKSRIGSRAEVNAAYFYTEYKDLQVSIYDGILGFNVGNAAEAVSQGIEVDGRFLVSENLTLSASLAWLDFEFKEFPNGQCVQGQVPDSGTHCNYRGKSNQYVAEWSGNLSADYRRALTDGLEFRSTIDLIYSADYNPSQNLDARVEQSSYTKVNARIALAGIQTAWEVALVGKNLTDEKIVTYANDAPLAYNFFGTVAHYGILEAPRTVALQASYRF